MSVASLALVRQGAPIQPDIDRYLAARRRNLTRKSMVGYMAIFRALVDTYPNLSLRDLEPPNGTNVIEEFLNDRYGHLAARSYNKAHSTLKTFVDWHHQRGNLRRNPMASLERAKPRQFHRKTFSEEEWLRIFAANPEPRDQIALHLLLDYGVRKGALRNVRFEHFDWDARRLTIFTKGEKIFHIPIPDERIWRLLAQLDAPGSHYLLCRHETRRRKPPHRRELMAAAWLTDELAATLGRISDDHCERELEQTEPAIEHLRRWISLAAEAASVKVTHFPEEQIGEHGCHDWWYRCLHRAGVVPRGITRGARMHQARHTAGQRLLDQTGNLKAVQSLLCHTNVATTGNAYVGWDEGQLAENLRGYVSSEDLAEDLIRRTRQ